MVHKDISLIIPPEIESLIQAKVLERNGSIVRDVATGKVHSH